MEGIHYDPKPKTWEELLSPSMLMMYLVSRYYTWPTVSPLGNERCQVPTTNTCEAEKKLLDPPMEFARIREMGVDELQIYDPMDR